MKLLVDARMAYPPNHGIARYTMNLIRGLKGSVELHLIVQGSQAVKFFRKEAPWVQDYVVTYLPFANPLSALELSAAISHRYDLVHFTSFSIPSSCSCKFVVTIHDLIHLKEGGSLFHRLYYHTLVRRALQKSRRVIAVSQWTRDDLVDTFGITAEKITVVSNGLESQWFSASGGDLPTGLPGEDAFRKKFDLHAQYICCVSNTKPHKNLATLFRACESLWSQGRSFELALLIGKSELPEFYKVNPLFRPRIKLLTRLSEGELMALYKYAHTTVSPSQYEGYSFPVAESLVMGTPVVLSYAAAHKEFLGEGLHFYQNFSSSENLAAGLTEILELTNRPSAEIPAHPHRTKVLPSNIIDEREMAARTLEVYRLALS